MNAPVSHATLASPGTDLITMGFGNVQQFEFTQRAAKMVIESTLVPMMYRHWVPESKSKNAKLIENVNALPNAVVALNMASRMGIDALMVMQNLNVIEGRPSWASTFVIGMINTCGRFSTLRFRIQKLGLRDITYAESYWEDQPGGGPGKKKYRPVTVTVQDMSCVAWCKELATGDVIESPEVTMEMAICEGWYGRDGSKWKTMPELMLHYRTAAFFGRLYAPDLLMGLQTAEELRDIGLLVPQEDGTYAPADVSPPPASGAGVRPPQSKSAAAAGSPPPSPSTEAQSTQSPQGEIDSDGVISEAVKPVASPAPSSAPAPAATPAPPAAPSKPCSEGELKFLLKKAVNKPLVLQQALTAVGFRAIDEFSPEQVTELVDKVNWQALDGLTTDQFKVAKGSL